MFYLIYNQILAGIDGLLLCCSIKQFGKSRHLDSRTSRIGLIVDYRIIDRGCGASEET